MQLAEAMPGIAVWADGNGFSVNYSIDVIQDLRRLAVDGFNAFRHGGKEIGGVLYGRPKESGPAVLAYAELDCEHALGPRFFLSEKDHTAMAALMEPRDGLQAIGWFRAHTRSGLELDAKDRELFDRYFESPGSLGLVIKPTQWGPASAAFYARRDGGEIGPEPFREFAIELPRRQQADVIPIAADIPPNPLVAPMQAEPAPASDQRNRTQPVAAPSAPSPIARPRVQAPALNARRSWPWAMCAGALLGALITLVIDSRPSRQVHADAPPQASPIEATRVAEADRAAPDRAPSADLHSALHSAPDSSAATQAFEPPARKEEIKPKQRAARIPRIVPAEAAPPVSFPPPPPAMADFAAAPRSLDVALPLMSLVSPPSVPSGHASYTGPRQGRLIWTGDLARHGVIQMDGSRVSPGSLAGALPGVPLLLRIMSR